MNFSCKALSISGLTLVLSCSVVNAATNTTKMEGFVKNFCAKSMNKKGLKETVFTIPSNLFSDKEVIFSCKDGDTYKMYRVDATDDPGHYIFNIEATKKVGDVYDCDGKADVGMKVIGLNCYPAKKETAQHRK